MSPRSRAAALLAAYAIALVVPVSAQEDRAAAAGTAALARLSEWFGPSESPPPADAGGPLFAPSGGMEVERIAVRAAAKMYWQRAVAPAAQWLLDDLADYSADRVVPELFARIAQQPGYAWPVVRYFGGFVPFAVKVSPLTDPPIESRGAWLATLERRIGWPEMQALLRSVRERGISEPIDASALQAMAAAATGRDLDAFFRQVGREPPVFDYGVDRLVVERRGPQRFRSTVVVRRYGEGVFPVDVESRFAGGAIVTEHWDGAEPMWRFVYESAAPIESAAIDPGGVLRLDRRRSNNVRTTMPPPTRSIVSWSGTWLTWLQDCLLTFAALA
jgi:hypothetical protein